MPTSISLPVNKFTPSGNIDSTSIQNAIAELDAEKVGKSGTETVTGVKTFSNNLTVSGGTLSLNNATSNLLSFSAVGNAAPAFTTRSTGTRISLSGSLNATNAEYAIGYEASHIWSSVNNTGSGSGFKWYAGITELMRLRGDGELYLYLSAPTGVTATTTTGGTLAAGTYYYKVAGLVNSILTPISSEVSATVDGSSTNAITISWAATPGVSYRVYKGAVSNGQTEYTLTGFGAGSFTDIGTAATAGTPSATVNPGALLYSLTKTKISTLGFLESAINTSNYVRITGNNYTNSVNSSIAIDNCFTSGSAATLDTAGISFKKGTDSASFIGTGIAGAKTLALRNENTTASYIRFQNSTTTFVNMRSDTGTVGIGMGTTASNAALQVAGGLAITSGAGAATDPGSGNLSVGNTGTFGSLKLSALNTAPVAASAAGSLGEIRVTSGYIFVAVATNTWVRAPLATW